MVMGYGEWTVLTLDGRDTETGEDQAWTSDGTYVGEALFVPEGDAEDRGSLLAMSYTENGSELLVLDAQHVEKGPVCRIPLPESFPYAFHGVFLKN